jgi:hypothetical protein
VILRVTKFRPGLETSTSAAVILIDYYFLGRSVVGCLDTRMHNMG